MDKDKVSIKLEGVLTISKNNQLEAICYLDQKTHNNILFKVSKLGMEDIKNLLESISGDTGIKVE